MHKIAGVVAILILAMVGPIRADQPPDMKALVDRAIKAHGGEAILTNLKAETFKGKVKYYGMGEGLDYAGSWAVLLPDKMRVQIDSKAGDNPFTFIRVVNGDKVWVKLGDNVEEVTDKERIGEAKEELYVNWVASLLPLKDKAFDLKPLGGSKVNSKPAVGIRVSHKGHRDVSLFFDKKSGLIVKFVSVVKDEMAGGKEFTQETILSDYKAVKGVQQAMKVVINRDGKLYITGEVTEIDRKAKLDDKLFTKP